ncbi:MAG: hypothetical protein IT285_12725 [Bdellovibrionales bacterium]|nr:hypothetical protein [Bdellovibrionales bacterium]
MKPSKARRQKKGRARSGAWAWLRSTLAELWSGRRPWLAAWIGVGIVSGVLVPRVLSWVPGARNDELDSAEEPSILVDRMERDFYASLSEPLRICPPGRDGICVLTYYDREPFDWAGTRRSIKPLHMGRAPASVISAAMPRAQPSRGAVSPVELRGDSTSPRPAPSR